MTNQDLYLQFAESIGASDSKLVPEIARKLADENEIQVVMAASPPQTIEKISEKTGVATDELEKMLEVLFIKGLMFKFRKPDAIYYGRPRHLIQFHDASILMPGVPKEVLNMWREFGHGEWHNFLDLFEKTYAKPEVRVIPVDVSISPESKIQAFEDVKKIVEDANRLAVVDCTCRLLEASPCEKPLEVCMQINRAADYALERGTGREITKDEALEMLKMCQKEGLVHTTINKKSVGTLICNCCKDCCINWPDSRKVSQKVVAPSRFLAVVDEDLCTGCEVCLDRCYFDAITMDGEGGTALINEENCMGCGLCSVTCDAGALRLLEKRPEAFVQDEV